MTEINLAPELECIVDSRECVERTRKLAQENLKNLRESIGVTQEDFAKVMGISRATLSYYENGNRTPDMDFINMVAVRTDCSLEYLLGWSENMVPRKLSLEDLHFLNEKEIKSLDYLCSSDAFRALLVSHEFLEMISFLNRYSEYALSNGCDYEVFLWRCISLITPILESIILMKENKLRKDPKMQSIYDKRRSEVFDVMYSKLNLVENENKEDEARIPLDTGEAIKSIKSKNLNNPFFAFRERMTDQSRR